MPCAPTSTITERPVWHAIELDRPLSVYAERGESTVSHDIWDQPPSRQSCQARIWQPRSPATQSLKEPVVWKRDSKQLDSR
jgi:hypothetical protein